MDRADSAEAVSDANTDASTGTDTGAGVDDVVHWPDAPGDVAESKRRSVSALPAMVEQIETLLDEAAGVPAWSMDDTELTDVLGRVATLQARLDELSSRMVVAAEHMDLPRQAGKTSTTAWVATVAGTGKREASRLVSLTRILSSGQAEPTRAAWAGGTLTTAAARVIGQCLAHLGDDLDPDGIAAAQATLIERAGHMSIDDLTVLSNRVIELIDPDGADDILAKQLENEERRAHQDTTFKLQRVGDGTTRLSGRIPDAQAAMLRTALEALASPRRTGNDPERDGDPTGPARPFPVRMGHALCELVEHLPEDRLPQAGGMSATITMTMDYQQLWRQLGRVTTGAGVDVSAAQARRLACSAGLIPAVLGTASTVLDHGTRRRLYTRAQRNAIALRDGGCNWPQCDRPAAWCETHHLQPWSKGGPTDINNGAMFCSVHHHLLHEGQWIAQRAPDGIVDIIPPPRVDPEQKPRRHNRHQRYDVRVPATGT